MVVIESLLGGVIFMQCVQCFQLCGNGHTLGEIKDRLRSIDHEADQIHRILRMPAIPPKPECKRGIIDMPVHIP